MSGTYLPYGWRGFLMMCSKYLLLFIWQTKLQGDHSCCSLWTANSQFLQPTKDEWVIPKSRVSSLRCNHRDVCNHDLLCLHVLYVMCSGFRNSPSTTKRKKNKKKRTGYFWVDLRGADCRSVRALTRPHMSASLLFAFPIRYHPALTWKTGSAAAMFDRRRWRWITANQHEELSFLKY